MRNAFGTSSGAAVLAWTAGELGPTGLTTGPPRQVLALVGFALGFSALFAAYTALCIVLSQRPQPAGEPYRALRDWPGLRRTAPPGPGAARRANG